MGFITRSNPNTFCGLCVSPINLYANSKHHRECIRRYRFAPFALTDGPLFLINVCRQTKIFDCVCNLRGERWRLNFGRNVGYICMMQPVARYGGPAIGCPGNGAETWARFISLSLKVEFVRSMCVKKVNIRTMAGLLLLHYFDVVPSVVA